MKQASITNIQARQIIDSRGNPTVEVDLTTSTGICARASVPSGASTGEREALELRDGDLNNFQGKSVLKAINHIHHEIAKNLIGLDVKQQQKIDQLMIDLDGTEDKSRLGANAILGVSLACARAGALESNKPLYQYLREDLHAPIDPSAHARDLPIPLMNVINGGMHASNNLEFQEFMIVPNLGSDFSRNLQAGIEVFHTLKKILNNKNYSTNVGDEGGFAPSLQTHEIAIDLLIEAINKSGYNTDQIKLSLDCAASEFYNKENKNYIMQGKNYSTKEMIDLYQSYVEKYPIYSIEDGLSESDHQGHKDLTSRIGNKVLLIGDDLFVTNKKIFKNGIENKECNSILIKLNQIGTLSETFETIQLAFENNYRTIISHRSGETADTFIADLAVAVKAGMIKTGSASRSDRVEKYNQLLRIQENFR